MRWGWPWGCRHSLQSYLQEAVAIGDDEGEDIYVFMTGESGFGIYRTSFADPDPDEVVFTSVVPR